MQIKQMLSSPKQHDTVNNKVVFSWNVILLCAKNSQKYKVYFKNIVYQENISVRYRNNPIGSKCKFARECARKF